MRLEVPIQGKPFVLEANGFSPVAYHNCCDADYFEDSVAYRDFYADIEGEATMPARVYEIVVRYLYTWHCQALDKAAQISFRKTYPDVQKFMEALDISDVLNASWTVYVMWLVQHRPAAEKKKEEDPKKTGQ